MGTKLKTKLFRLSSALSFSLSILAFAQEVKDCPYQPQRWDGPSVMESLDLKLSGISRDKAIGYLLSEYKSPAAQSFAVPILFYLSATEEKAKLKLFYEELGLELSGGIPLNRTREKLPERKGFKTGKLSVEELCTKIGKLNKVGGK